MSPPRASLLSADQVLQGAYDDSTGTLRTTATATVVGGDLTVETSHTHDSIRLGDGTNYIGSTEVGSQNGLDVYVINSSLPITITPNSAFQITNGNVNATLTTIGANNALDVNLVNNTPLTFSVFPQGAIFKSIFNDAGTIASGATVQIGSYTVPNSHTALLQQINAGGDNIAVYYVYLNGILIDQQRTYFGGNTYALFTYNTGVNPGYNLNSNDQITIFVYNFRPTPADFNSRIQVIQN